MIDRFARWLGAGMDWWTTPRSVQDQDERIEALDNRLEIVEARVDFLERDKEQPAREGP